MVECYKLIYKQYIHTQTHLKLDYALSVNTVVILIAYTIFI